MRIIPKNLSAGNLALGVGIVLLAPVVLPIVGAIAKPLVKAGIKGVLVTYEGAKVALAEAKEAIEDITAEAKAEIAGDVAEEE